MIVVLKCGAQGGNEGMSEAVERDIDALVKRNKDEPEQRLAEVAAIKEVNPISHHRHKNNTYDDNDDDNDDDNHNNTKHSNHNNNHNNNSNNDNNNKNNGNNDNNAVNAAVSTQPIDTYRLNSNTT